MQTTFVAVCYAATFGGLGILVVAMMRRARHLAQRLPVEDRPWI